MLLEPGLLLPDKVVRSLPAMVRNELGRLSAGKQEEFLEEYSRRARPLWAAYLACLACGCHYAYLRLWREQAFFWVTAGGLLVWWVVDLVRLPSLVADFNRTVAIDVLRDLQSIIPLQGSGA